MAYKSRKRLCRKKALFGDGAVMAAATLAAAGMQVDATVQAAKELTAKGKSCVLSPAAASYNDFKNFEERGDAFKKLVFSK